MTGSGKTTLAERLLSAEEYVIAIDTKGDLKWKGWKVTSSLPLAFSLKHSIFRPKNEAQIIALFRQAFKEGGWYIYVDEVYMLGKKLLSPRTGESPYVICLTSGRSKGVTVLTSTQRPKYLPIFALTESQHFFIFELGSQDDLKDVVRMAGIDALNVNVGNHRFLYYYRPKKQAVVSKINV